MALKELLIKYIIEHKSKYVSPNLIIQKGPGCLRDAKNRDHALNMLQEHLHLRIHKSGRTHLVELNPKLIPSFANANLANLG